jgi:hypothetical protein
MWFVDRLGKKEFGYVRFNDNDNDNDKEDEDLDEHKYLEDIHSRIKFDFVTTHDRYDFLTIYVFFSGTFVWFNEFLSLFVKQDTRDDIDNLFSFVVVASASYTASFYIGYFDVLGRMGVARKWSIAFYILVTFYWFHYKVPSLMPDIHNKSNLFDVVSANNIEHDTIMSLSHTFSMVIGSVLREEEIKITNIKNNLLEYSSIMFLVYAICSHFGAYIVISFISFVVLSVTTIHYVVFKNLDTDVLHNTRMEGCPFYNDVALISYQTYPVCASIVYLSSFFFTGYSTIPTFAFRAFWYYSRKLPLYQLLLEVVFLIPTFYSSSFFNYFYVVYSIPIISQILRNPYECIIGCIVLYKLSNLQDITSLDLANTRDIMVKLMHDHGSFRIPMLDAAFIATTKIPKSISKNSDTTITSPFVKCIHELIGDTIFLRDTDDRWSETKKELRRCIQKPTFQMIEQSSDPLDLGSEDMSPNYSDNNGFEILSRIISRIMMIEILGLEMPLEDFDICYDKYMNPNKIKMCNILNNSQHIDKEFSYSLFENLCEICKNGTALRPDGWLSSLLYINHKITIKTLEELNEFLEKTRLAKDDELIKTMNETSFMFMLAVPTTASLSSRCIHVLNYIRDTDNEKYESLMQNAADFYTKYKDKDDTLKKPIKGDEWVDFVVNVLYWWPPTMASVKLMRQKNDIYHPGDIVFIGLNCDRNAPSFENTFDRYAYMLDHPSTTSHEALWQDERVCAAAFFAQNEAAFILAKMYSKYIVSIGESKPGSFMVNRIDYHMHLEDK